MLLIRAKAELSAIMIADLKKAVVLPCFIAKSCDKSHLTAFNVMHVELFVKDFFEKNGDKVACRFLFISPIPRFPDNGGTSHWNPCRSRQGNGHP